MNAKHVNDKASKHKTTHRSEKREHWIGKPNEAITGTGGKRNTQEEGGWPS